jgi:anti-sigma factor (TIGR02949 family)
VGRTEELGCASFREALYAYLDGELSGHARDRVEDHSDRCGSCSRALEVERFWGKVLKGSMRHVRSPEALRDRVRAGLEMSPSVWSARLSWRRVVPVVSLAAAVLVVAVLAAPLWERIGGSDATRNTLRVTGLAGLIVDLQCDSQGATLEQQRQCFSNHLNGLKRGDGRYYHLEDSDPARGILSEPGVRGRFITVSGTLRRNGDLRFLRIDDVQWPRDGGELL